MFVPLLFLIDAPGATKKGQPRLKTIGHWGKTRAFGHFGRLMLASQYDLGGSCLSPYRSSLKHPEGSSVIPVAGWSKMSILFFIFKWRRMTGNEDTIYESCRRRHDELGRSKSNAIALNG